MSVYSPKKWEIDNTHIINNHIESNNFNHYTPTVSKLTCRYEVKIENDKNFQVAKKIIGSGGCNMKKIIEAATHKYNKNSRDLLKLRLRGIGSGYKEGPENRESHEPLHLCVSAKN